MSDDQFGKEFEAAKIISETLLGRLAEITHGNVDLAALEQLMKEHPEVRSLYERLNDATRRQAIFEDVEDSGKDLKADLERLLTKIKPAPSIQPVRRVTPTLTYYFYGAAACVAVVLVSLIAIKHLGSHKAENHPVVAMTNDIAPGGNKAVLTLANGQKIVLDSTHNGVLAQQGDVHVLKSDDGQIDYKVGLSETGEVAYNTMSTPPGGTFKLTLGDGTRVWLNAGSSLRYPVSFSGQKTRVVELTGEGYFEIAPNPSAPFFVNAGQTSVHVLGTHVNVMAYSDENRLETTLLEGSVSVNYNRENRILRPGQQASISKNGEMSVNAVNANDYIAWKNGLIQLNHRDVAGVMRQISRWYNVPIEYDTKDGKSPGLVITGTIPRTLNLSDVIQSIQYAGIHCTLKEGKKLVVTE